MVENRERGSLTAGTPGWEDDGGCFLLPNTPLTILRAPPGDGHALGPAKSGKRVSALLGAGEAARLRLSGGGSVSPIPSPSAVAGARSFPAFVRFGDRLGGCLW